MVDLKYRADESTKDMASVIILLGKHTALESSAANQLLLVASTQLTLR